MGYTVPATRSTTLFVTASIWNTDLVENIKFLANPPACRVYRTTSQSIPHNTVTALTFNAERFDTDTMHSTSSLTNRITIKTAGLYQIFANVSWDSAAGNTTRKLSLVLNGATEIFVHQIDGATGVQAHTVGGVYKFAVNDYIECWMYHFQGGAVNVTSLGNSTPEFGAVWVGLG